MNILALDLGTSTGFAFNVGEKFECGTALLGTPGEIKAWGKDRTRRRCDLRIPRLYRILKEISPPDVVVFEDVIFGSTTYQVQLWASLRAVVWLVFPPEKIECVHVGTLKKFATGHGGATKECMAKALARQDSRFSIDKNEVSFGKNLLDDNAVDAVWLWHWAKQNLSRTYGNTRKTV